ncbi:MAG: HEAT repeat domain-containing protein [Nitrospiraceae bacterium]
MSDAETHQNRHTTTIFVDLAFSTWMKHGHTLSQIAPSVKMKLVNAGFVVVPQTTDPHDLTLRVEYREEQGKQYRIDTFGTEIIFRARLEHHSVGQILDLSIKEDPGPLDSGTPPYLETLQRFDTNPYFYFLGDILAAKVRSNLDTTAALIRSLSKLGPPDPAKSEPATTDHGVMLPGDTLYASLARENTIRELGRLEDRRAVPVLVSLLQQGKREVRLLAVEALRNLNDSAEATSALEQAAAYDPDRDIRQAAAGALNGRP